MSYADDCAREFWRKHDFVASLSEDEDDQPICAPTRQLANPVPEVTTGGQDRSDCADATRNTLPSLIQDA